MALTQRLDLRQTQSLIMTPQLQQAIKLLQLSSLDLQAFVETQLEQNPLLERDDAPLPDGAGGIDALEPDATTFMDGEPRSLDTAVGGDQPAFAEAELDLDYRDNLFDADPVGDVGHVDAVGGAGRADRGGSFDADGQDVAETLSMPTTLREHLLAQASVEFADAGDRLIALHLIDMLDESGYLVGDLSQVAELLGCAVERVAAVLARAQQFDPAGVLARNLAECLALQLKDRGRFDPAMAALLDHLPLLAKRDTAALCRACGVDLEDLTEMVAEIRALNPKPGLLFDHTPNEPVTPDVMMRPLPNGGWSVELNTDVLPRVLVNNRYHTQISRGARRKEDKHYINDCLQSANWLVKSLHQRATTILKVATEIVRQQQAFFSHGVRALRPLVLRDIAEAIGMHESTVSRVTSNKFIATPRGIHELKYFFTHAIGGNDGETHSAEAVRHRIRAMIDAESLECVLSDDALAEILQKDGIDIARRTIAKYREAMGIPSSVQRRRRKASAL